MKLPKTAVIWPLMAIHAQDTKHAGAYRLHVLASTLDHGAECDHVLGICKGGSGKILRAQLQAAAEALKVKRSTFYNWLADARQAGILNGEGEYLYLASQEKLFEVFLCNSLDKHKAVISLKALFQPGWKVIVWAAYTKANHNGKLISARKLEAVTGVPERTQRRLNGLVKRRRNIAITTTNGTLEGMYEHRTRHGKFLFIDPNQGNRRVIAFSIPARRTVNDKHAKIGARGRRRQILAANSKSLRLVQVCNYPHSVPTRQAGPLIEGFTPYAHLFHETPRQIERAGEGYITRNRRYGVGVWDALIIQSGALGTDL